MYVRHKQFGDEYTDKARADAILAYVRHSLEHLIAKREWARAGSCASSRSAQGSPGCAVPRKPAIPARSPWHRTFHQKRWRAAPGSTSTCKRNRRCPSRRARSLRRHLDDACDRASGGPGGGGRTMSSAASTDGLIFVTARIARAGGATRLPTSNAGRRIRTIMSPPTFNTSPKTACTASRPPRDARWCSGRTSMRTARHSKPGSPPIQARVFADGCDVLERR